MNYYTERQVDGSIIHVFEGSYPTNPQGQVMTFGRNYRVGTFQKGDEVMEAGKYYFVLENEGENETLTFALGDEDMEELFRAWLESREEIRMNP